MTTIGELGEFGTLETIAKYCPSAKAGEFEDANLMKVGNSWYINNTDSLPNHLPMFSPFHTPEKDKFYSAGWISVITTMNDLAVSGNQKSMGFSTRLVLHPDLELKDLDSFTRGVSDACGVCDVPYTGGDTTIKDFQNTKGKPRLIECTTNAVGYLGDKDYYISRNTAKPEDLIALTAKSGVGWAKLVELTNAGFNFSNNEYLQFCYNHKNEMIPVDVFPTIPYKAFAESAYELRLSSATDLSDGLIIIYETSFKKNGKGMNLEFNSGQVSDIAKDVCSKRDIHPINALISQGLDAPNMHMMTFDSRDEGKVRDSFFQYGRRLHIIGSVTDKPGIECSYEGEKIEVQSIFADGAMDERKAEGSLVWYKQGDGNDRS